MTLTESIVEDAALEWLGELGYVVGHGIAFAAMRRPKPQMASVHLSQMAESGAYPDTPPEIIGAMQVVLPDEPKTIEASHHLCAPLFEQAEADLIQSRALTTLRDTLLPLLLDGELNMAKFIGKVKFSG